MIDCACGPPIMASMRANSPKLRFGAATFAREPADRRARMEAANIEIARGLPDLEPHIAGERLVGALAGEHGLVALRMHIA